MRLLHTERLEVIIVEEDEIAPYAILSHTWSHDDEVSLQDFEKLSQIERSSLAEAEHSEVRIWSPGWRKIIRAASMARNQQYQWFVFASQLSQDRSQTPC